MRLVCCAFTVVKDLLIFMLGFIECKSESVRDNVTGKILDEMIQCIKLDQIAESRTSVDPKRDYDRCGMRLFLCTVHTQ